MSHKLNKPCRPMQPCLQDLKESETAQQTTPGGERTVKFKPTRESSSIFKRAGSRSNSEVDPKPSWQRHFTAVNTSLDTKSLAFKRDTFENLSSPKVHDVPIPKLDDSGFEESTASYYSWESNRSRDLSNKYRARSSSKKRKGFSNCRDKTPNTKVARIPSFDCSKKPQFSKDRMEKTLELQMTLIRQVQFPKVTFLEKIRSFI